MICGCGGSKSRLAKAAGAEPCGQMRDENLHAVVARSIFPTQNVQNTPFWDHFWRVELSKVHAGVARSKFRSQNARNISMSKHFWKLRCRKVHAVVARSTFRSQNVQSTPPSKHFWKLRCLKSARRCGAKHLSKSKVQNADGYGSLLDVQMSFCVAGARDCAPCQKWAKHEGFVTVSTKSTTTLHPTPLHYSYNYDYVYDYSTLHYAN